MASSGKVRPARIFTITIVIALFAVAASPVFADDGGAGD